MSFYTFILSSVLVVVPADTELRMEASASYAARMGIWDAVYEYPEGNTIPPDTDIGTRILTSAQLWSSSADLRHKMSAP